MPDTTETRDDRITETITFKFDDEAQQRRFHERLKVGDEKISILEREIERLSRELLEAKEVALRYQTIAGKQGNMLMRKSLLLEMAMAYIEYDEAEFLVSEAASIIRYGIENPGEPLPWPSSPGLQKWLVGKGRSNCDGHIGMRLTMQIADGVTVNDRSVLSPKKDSDNDA